MASEAVTIVLETARDLLIEEARFLSGVSDQVKGLEAELIWMQCFLKDADKRQHKEETVRYYVREIRRLAYRIENVLDKFAIEVESQREGQGFRKALKKFACILCEGRALHMVGSEIANIKEIFSSLTTSLQTYGIREMSIEEGQSSSNQNQQRLRQTYPHQVEEYFVGMTDDIRQLVSLITDEEIRSHRVIAIHGMGGIGKTTLARKIYNHADVQRGFKAFAWVSITQQYNTRTILRDILKQLLPDHGKEGVEKIEERELVGELYKVQKETKCMVVLDDLWETTDWESLKFAFPFVEANSKILITTRNQNLAAAEFPYALQFLNEDEGWELLQKRAFARRDAKDSENDPKLEAIGRNIVRRCGKLPLAISVLGGVLSQKNSLYEWETVNRYVDSYSKTSEGSKEGYGSVLQVLALSYDELPYHLKPCFLYLGNFREDEDIDVEILYKMWTAEGMVSSDDVAESYLYEMASRSMVQVKLDEFSTYRRVESCYLHDLMRDFCLARGKEVEFLELLDFRGGKDPLSDSSTDKFGTPSRCSIQMASDGRGRPANDSITMALEANGQLRSLLISASTGSGYWNVYISFPRLICDSGNFKYLRILKLEAFNFGGQMLPKGIKKLIHLRFLSLRRSLLDKLPSSIGQLQYLQTLDLRVGNSLLLMPNVLWKLKRLRHLYLANGCRTADYLQTGIEKLRFVGLSKLETLAGFHKENVEFNDVSELKNLRLLDAIIRVREENDLSEVLNFINSNQHKLREARLNISFYCSTSLKDLFTCLSLHRLILFSSSVIFDFSKLEPPLSLNLSELMLGEFIEGDPMDFLGKLSNLRRLTLCVLTLVNLDRKMMICDANAFPKLISLEIECKYGLKKWVVAQGSMPNLSYLAIKRCSELEMIPDGLRFIRTLAKLVVIMMPKQFTQRIQRGGEDYDKISHVPLITIQDAREDKT